MITLVIDTCLDACSVALCEDVASGVIAGRHEPMSRGHAEVLLPLIDEVFKDAGIGAKRLQRIVVTRGPGTFTGVRIGLSAARGLVIGTDIRIGAISSLRAIALCAIEADAPQCPVVSAIDARRNELYVAVHAPDGSEVLAPVIVPVGGQIPFQSQDDMLVAGSGVPFLTQADPLYRPSTTPVVPDARVWGPLAAVKTELLQDPVPLYLRRPDAKPPSPGSQVALAST